MTLLTLALGTTAVMLLAVGASWAIAGWVRRVAPMDVPNERSSHARPTPRGGGVAIVAVVLGGLLLGAFAGIDWRVAAGFTGGGLALAVVGWLDDLRGLGALPRALVHLAAAAVAALGVGVPSSLALGTMTLPLGLAAWPLALLAIAWCCNAYNFMDGIDGLAGVTGVTTGLAAANLLLERGAVDLAAIALLTSAACAGFLLWNWPPARLFMGDVGSGFLGFVFGALALASVARGLLPIASWVLLLGVFLADTTVTLVRRMLAGERWYAAHRSHAYQRAVQSGWSHRQVTTAALALNVALALLAGWLVRDPAATLPALGVAALLLGGCYIVVERRRPMRPVAAGR